MPKCALDDDFHAIVHRTQCCCHSLRRDVDAADFGGRQPLLGSQVLDKRGFMTTTALAQNLEQRIPMPRFCERAVGHSHVKRGKMLAIQMPYQI